jgi:4-hydroxybenzoyl-CoA reductase subunit beta
MDEISFGSKKGLIIGARASLTQLSRSPLLHDHYPAIAQASYLVATGQIRNMATLGGNICQNTRCRYYNRTYEWQKTVIPCFKRGGNICHVVKNSKRCFAVYQGDMAPAIIALNGKVTLTSPEGTKQMPLEKIFTGDGKAPFNMSYNTILTSVEIPASGSHHLSLYRKYRMRDGTDYPLAGVAIGLQKNSKKIDTMRICITGTWSSPVLVKDVEKFIAGNSLTRTIIKELAEAAFNTVHPLDNVEDTPVHRRETVKLMVEEMLTELSEK